VVNLSEFFEALDEEAIQRFVASRQEEHLQLEFKLVRDPDVKASEKDRLAKAMSAFANSDGGVIVWGVDARQNDGRVDAACEARPIGRLKTFLSRLNELTGEVVSPTVDGVRHKAIPIGTGDEGYAATLVPASDAGPHMARGGLGRYFKRSGDSSYPMEHFDIADMFGKRRAPRLECVCRVLRGSSTFPEDRGFRVVLGISNVGRGPAVAPYLSVRIAGPYGRDQWGLDGNGFEGLPRLARATDSPWLCYGGSTATVIHPGTSLDVMAVDVLMRPANSNSPSMVVEYRIAADGFRLTGDTLTMSAAELLQLEI
jgi:hypothetical protein